MHPRIVHELTGPTAGRLRLVSPLLRDQALDASYLQAFLVSRAGIRDVRVNRRAASLIVSYDGRPETRRRILELLDDVPAEAYHVQAERRPASWSGVAMKLLVAALTPLLPRPLKLAVSVVNCLPLMLRGADTLLCRGIKVEVLDGVVVAFSLLRRDYFTANAIVAMLDMAGAIEAAMEQRSDELLKSLLAPQSGMVWVERGGQEIQVAIADLAIGDHVVVGAGEAIPVDGLVLSGEASVNTSSITGEAVPRHLHPGEEALSGGVVEDGRVVVQAREVGSSTRVARVGRFLEQSLRFKSKGETESRRLADRLVPLTFFIGLGMFFITRDIRRATSVLTVDFSCALKLASPVAVKSGMFVASRHGVLLKGSQALESLAQADALVFDKTGTLTTGELSLGQVVPVNGQTPDALLAMAAAAEEHYGHPIARAVVREARERGLRLPVLAQVNFIVAHGVSATVEGENVLVGSHHFIAEDEGIDCSAIEEAAAELRAQGATVLYVAQGGRLAGVLAMQDRLRPRAGLSLSGLKDMGVKRIVVLTGDHRQSAEHLAQALPQIDEIHAELKPEDKARLIKDLKSQGYSVAFAGDGVNDAPALLCADVGVCMAQGADLARESAQAVLMTEDIGALTAARRVALETQQRIRNAFYATVGINSLVLGLAGLGFLGPLAAALLHNATTVSILGYAALPGVAVISQRPITKRSRTPFRQLPAASRRPSPVPD